MALGNQATSQRKEEHGAALPAVSLPKGGGAVRGIGEKFAANPVTGTGSTSVPLATSPSRSGFGPQLSLTYDSGAGNGPFGFGWNLSLPSITRKTDKGLPRYQDGDESDTFILSGAEDLVPVLTQHGDDWIPEIVPDRTIGGDTYRIKRYRPRIEGLFARIERWTNTQTQETHWRSISRDNIITVYGRTAQSRIEDPDAPEGSARVFSWLICESYDDRGNAVCYEYEKENSAHIDLAFVHERNRTDTSRSANRYLKRIRYGNRTPIAHDADFPREFREDLSERTDWLFDVVFDYEEGHYEALPADADGRRFVDARIDPTEDWQRRQDPFSSYRAGFEVRTYRLCRRVLMFHHFPDELDVDAYLVRATEFEYNQGPIASFITSVTQAGFVRQNDGTYLKQSLPPHEFTYSEAVIQDDVQTVDEESLEHLPHGLDGVRYRWADIDGEGSSGILTEQGGSWFYKRNLSPLPVVDADGNSHVTARFAPIERLEQIPSFSNLSDGRQQLLDVAGDGQLDVVELDSATPGFYERTNVGTWHRFRPFVSLPNVVWHDPNLQFADLTGDGHADIFVTEDDAFTWYPSLAEQGFAGGERVRHALDEEQGPKLIFADGAQSVYLVDFSGDGLQDLARIRNGEVCYWPNLGYGRFGAKVTMDNSPYFDAPDQFDQRRIRVADIDGSGVTDIIYLKDDGVYIYLNESGNRWANAEKLRSFPPIDNLSSVMAVDLLGNGTACLVWSSPLPAANGTPLQYIDLMGGQKPHLLVKTVNNLGAETHVHYAPSTRFYLADKEAGTPWITRIPFPVHVVERVETYDRISRSRFVTRYAFHHGYFDGIEREFRGFGMVEQWDTETYAALNQSQDFPIGDNAEESSHVPPILTRTWFHTGAYLDRHHLSNFYAGLLDADDVGEYYREPGLTDVQARELLLEDTILPDGLTVDEERDACRTLKGTMLRQEVYALDGTVEEPHPYTATEQNVTIRCVQPHGSNRHAVFFTHAREAISYHYERDPTDPRVAHAMTLEVDDVGNVLKEVAIGYGRRQLDVNLSPDDRAKQAQTLITYTENRVTNAIEAADEYRTPLPCETQTYELTGYTPTGAAGRFRISDFVQPDPSDPGAQRWIHIFDGEVDYEEEPPEGRQRRPIEHLRTLFRPDDLGVSLNDPLALLPLGTIEPLALPGETYKLAFTPGLLAQVYQRSPEGQPSEPLLPDPATVLGGPGPDRGGYVDLDGDDRWWIPCGRAFHSPNVGDTAAQELAYARQHFFLPHRYHDPFGQTSTIAYDVYDLLVLETRDPVGNRITVGERDAAGRITARGNDYRVLQPTLVSAPNRNRSAVIFDALGMVVATAVMGKPEEHLGDSLNGVEADLTEAVILDHLTNPLADPHAILVRATTRLVYDLFAYRRTSDQADPPPSVVYTIARETHDADLEIDQQTRVQHSFSYSDGFGREIQTKIQAEPGPVPLRDGEGRIVVGADGRPVMTEDDVTPRWVGSGWTVFNNKGKPVRQYEPFFTDTHRFEFDVRIGVSPVLFYDPVERVVATLNPDHTWEKVVFDPWRQETWDVNDTVLKDPSQDEGVGEFFRRLSEAEYLPTWYGARIDGASGIQEQAAARKTELHADTPTVAYLDSLGRPFLTNAHNRGPRDNVLRVDEFYQTRVVYDVEGNQRDVIDAKGRAVMRYDYDMLGNQIHSTSMDAGEHWMLNDVAGQPIRTWDARGHDFRTEYDSLRRPVRHFVRGTDAAQSDPRVLNREVLFSKIEYGEGQANDVALNLRTRIFKSYDNAGVVTNVGRNPLTDDEEAYDFKGNLLRGARQVTAEYRAIPDWAGAVDLESEVFSSSTAYDALNRPISLISPDSSEIKPIYNEANLLEQVQARVGGAAEWTTFVADLDYNARGQRELIEYGNGTKTTYEYDPLTFRLTTLTTTRYSEGDLQNLSYTYDPVGNISHIEDAAQQTIFFDNTMVTPDTDYVYDAIYQLIEATGREHIGQVTQVDHNDPVLHPLPHPNNGEAMRDYTETYEYDEVGNILAMIHQAHGGNWTRRYQYAADNNRLLATNLPGDDPDGPYTGRYEYNAHGSMTVMPHLPLVDWDFTEQMKASSRQEVNEGTPETTYYVYDAAGRRVRKVTERQAAPGETPTCVKERIYLGGFEVYREYGGDGTTVTLERETLHVMDDTQRIAMVETRTLGDDGSAAQLTRYQLGNHLGSVGAELDAAGRMISYEEYYPYGSTSYRAVDASIKAAAKRYRYTGKGRDEENCLYYHGARYYAPWLGRWCSVDPAELIDGTNRYTYVMSNPIKFYDEIGLQPSGGRPPRRAVPSNTGTFFIVEPSPRAPRFVPIEAETAATWREIIRREGDWYREPRETGAYSNNPNHWQRAEAHYESLVRVQSHYQNALRNVEREIFGVPGALRGSSRAATIELIEREISFRDHLGYSTMGQRFERIEERESVSILRENYLRERLSGEIEAFEAWFVRNASGWLGQHGTGEHHRLYTVRLRNGVPIDFWSDVSGARGEFPISTRQQQRWVHTESIRLREAEFETNYGDTFIMVGQFRMCGQACQPAANQFAVETGANIRYYRETELFFEANPSGSQPNRQGQIMLNAYPPGLGPQHWRGMPTIRNP